MYCPSVVALWALALAACVAVVGGCAGTAEEMEYVLDTPRQVAPAQAVDNVTLEVRRFTIDTAFASKNLVYRLDEFKYEVDPYRQFLVSPGTMIGEEARRWLADSGLFRLVLPLGSRMEATHTLEASVTALYGDFRDEAAPVAVMEIRFFLVPREAGPNVVTFSETYRATTRIPVRTPEALLEAYDKDLRDILTRLEADLRKALTNEADRVRNPAP
jgi:ABC-type uncharacterized transport system auxiliary subunit